MKQKVNIEKKGEDTPNVKRLKVELNSMQSL